MNSTGRSLFLYFLLLDPISVNALNITKILNTTYSIGVPFSKINTTTSNACLCSCIAHPHCLSISTTTLSSSKYTCQLFATYPINSSQLLFSSNSNVTLYTDRIIRSVYIANGSQLTSPTSLFSNTINPWIPAFKLFTGNNQTFLWLNSSSLTTQTEIPQIPINQIESHWFSVLISQWNENVYIPNEVALAFIVNRTQIFDFLIFNSSQSNISTWFSILRLLSNQYWGISQYRNSSVGQTQMTSVYTDNYCTRSFNINFKLSTGCSQDFYGFVFVYGGYKDTCIAAVQNMSQVSIPTIFYSPTSTYTNGNLSDFKIADGIMGFLR